MNGLERTIKEVNDEITILLEKEKNVKNPNNVVYYSNGLDLSIEGLNYLKGNSPNGESAENKNYRVIGCRLDEKNSKATYYILEDVIKRFHPDNRIKFSYNNISFYNIESKKWQDIDLRIVNQDNRGLHYLDDIKVVLKLDNGVLTLIYYSGKGALKTYKQAGVKKVKNNDDLYKILKGIRKAYRDEQFLLNDLYSLKQIMELMIPKKEEKKSTDAKLLCKECGSELDRETKSRCPCCGTKL